MPHNKRLIIALVVSTAFSYHIFVAPSLWDSVQTSAPLHQLHDTALTLESSAQPIDRSNIAVSAKNATSTIPNKTNSIALTNSAEISMNSDFTVVSAEVLKLEKQYRESNPLINESNRFDLPPDDIVTLEVAEREKQYREGKTPEHSNEEVYNHSNALITPETAELERQFRSGEIPLHLINKIDPLPDANITPEVNTLEEPYRQKETGQRQE